MAPMLEIERPWDLAVTGWGVVFAPDLDRRVRAELEVLLEHRRQQATSHGKSHYYKEYTYRGEPTYDFVKSHGGRPGMMADPDDIPYYLLLVGNPESLPYRFQAELDVSYAVGRIYFDNPTDYGNYARSALEAESLPRPRSKEIVFFGTKHENDPSTHRIAQNLLPQLAESVLEPGAPWKVREVLGKEARKERLRALLGGAETPAFLFAACHGLGCEADDEQQVNYQGALICQDWPGPASGKRISEDQWFAASDVPKEASLHGLIAFLHASYAVGTPPAMVSPLPQRLLSHHAGGALAVIGYVDRTWLPNFSGLPKNEGLGALLYGIRRLLQGHTVGWAMEYLNQSYTSLAVQLGTMEEGWRFREKVDKELFAYLSLIRQDARNVMVFGDPAVRLPGVGEPR